MPHPERAGNAGNAAAPRARADIESIRALSRLIGFDRLGVSSARLPENGTFFKEWLARGYQGEMAWIERSAETRLDPSLVMRDVRSILVGAVRYAPQPAPAPAALTGEVSCYAWGEDYHLVVGRMAADLAAHIRSAYGARAVEYVDTGPVLERLWAAQSGVGWVGKNSLVLHRDLGSYIFLAVVLTDLDLPPDAPALDQCGACALCVEACPTDAIVEPRVVDSRRCLSYHTIEKRGTFPVEYREAAGTRVFGCDECQRVCPWNQANAAVPAAFFPRPGGATPDLPSLLAMTLAEYTERFRGSAVKRATYQGLRRNAAVALGNLLTGRPTDDPLRPPLTAADREAAVSALRSAASDADPAVADAASWVLRRSGEAAS